MNYDRQQKYVLIHISEHISGFSNAVAYANEFIRNNIQNITHNPYEEFKIHKQEDSDPSIHNELLTVGLTIWGLSPGYSRCKPDNK